MIKKTLHLALSLIFVLSIIGCKDKVEEANTSNAEAAAISKSTSGKFTINVSESTIEWKGLRDKFINDNIELKISIKAKKA